MSQKGILDFFKKAPSKTAISSPVARKQTAIRKLSKFKLELEDDDFVLSEEEADEPLPKIATEEKLIKAKKAPVRTPTAARTKARQVPPPQDLEDAAHDHMCSTLDESALPDWLTTNLRDANRRKPTDPDYDPTTVHIPLKEEENFTPFQKQFWSIKRNNFDAIVLIRKGKFYEMFSVDAIFARDVLKLRLTFRGKEPMCGVPEKSFSEWALKIINAGKRVCKVEQTETAIDQKNRKGGDKAIHRELVQIYSIGTIDDFEMLESSQPSFLMALRSTERNRAGVVLVDCSLGSFHLGVVNEEDLADILVRYEPVEVVYHPSLICKEHLDMIKHLCGAIATRSKSQNECWDGQLAPNAIQRIAGWDEYPESLDKYEKEAIGALGGCAAYLESHKIAKSLLSLKRFSSLLEINAGRTLALDSSALTNLHVISRGSRDLLSTIDFCSTAFGKRRLRSWIMHPLRSVTAINDRLDAVEELMKPEFSFLQKELKNLPDLERVLARVYSNKVNVRAFLDCMDSLKKFADISEKLEGKVNSSLLRLHFPEGRGKSIRSQLKATSQALDKERSLQSNEYVVLKGYLKELDEIDESIAQIDADMQRELDRVRSLVKCSDIEFVHQQSERYQIQIPAARAGGVDDSFILMSQTKQVRRYHTPTIKSLLVKLETVENDRTKLRGAGQAKVIADFASREAVWSAVVEAAAEADCIASLASASRRWDGDICRPTFVDGPQRLRVKQMSYPLVAGSCIPNDIDIGNPPAIILTGPNASGKSTFARMCCTAIILAQIGCYLPAESAELTVFDAIFTRIGAGDRLFSGQSTFAVELSETARLMKRATSKSFVVLDELGRGTSTVDGVAIATAVLEFFVNEVKCPLVFCTHYHVLTEMFDKESGVRNASMKYADDMTLLYQIVDKPCPSSFGCAVARMCGIPEEITIEAQKVADDFERRHKALHVSKK